MTRYFIGVPGDSRQVSRERFASVFAEKHDIPERERIYGYTLSGSKNGETFDKQVENNAMGKR